MTREFFNNNEKDVFGGNLRARDQNKDRLKGGYAGDYYDENEHRAGQEKYDLATGEQYKNDGDIEAPEVSIVNEGEIAIDLIAGEFDGETEKYLLEHDSTYLGKGKWKESEAA